MYKIYTQTAGRFNCINSTKYKSLADAVDAIEQKRNGRQKAIYFACDCVAICLGGLTAANYGNIQAIFPANKEDVFLL